MVDRFDMIFGLGAPLGADQPPIEADPIHDIPIWIAAAQALAHINLVAHAYVRCRPSGDPGAAWTTYRRPRRAQV